MITTRGNILIDEGGSEWKAKGVAVHATMHHEIYAMGCWPETMGYEQLEVRLGKEAADAWWSRLEHNVFGEADGKWLADHGFNSIRVSFSWRRFTERTEDFHRILDICKRNNLRCIFDLHAAPGGQNPDGHGDSMGMRGMFWEFEALQWEVVNRWGRLAQELHGYGTELLGYEILNEPVTTIRHTSAFAGSHDDWHKLNDFYRQCIAFIRTHDPNRLILVNGDWYSEHYDGLELPDDPNLVLSPHQYVEAALNPNHVYDATETQEAIFHRPVWEYAKKHKRPMLWTEFGVMHLPDEQPSEGQLRATHHQKLAYEGQASGWFYWTYKDSMGLLRPTQWENAMKPLTDARLALGADNLGEGITPKGLMHDVCDILDFDPAYSNLPGVPAMKSCLSKYLRRAAQEGICYEWGQIVQDNPHWADYWQLVMCQEQPSMLNALFD